MNLSKLVVITGLFVTLGFTLSAQVKIGDNPLELATDRWWEVQREGVNEFLIVTDSLFFGRTSNPTSSTSDPLMLKLFGYGLENFTFGAGDQASNGAGNNYFLAPSVNGEVLEVPMNLSLVIEDSITADLSVTNGVDTFGTINLFALDSIFATDIAVADSISTIRTLINMSNNSDNDTITGNEYIDEINVIGDSILEFVENIAGRLGTENRISVDLSPIIEGNTFYLADGTLDEDRIVTGDNNSLNYNDIDTFDVDATFVNLDGDEVAIQQDGQDIIMINAAEDVKIRSSVLDSILALNGTNGSVTLGEYGEGNFNVSDFETILVVDDDGNIRETTADDILGAQVDSTIYNNDGVLTGDRTLDGDGNDLSFTDIGSLVDSSATSLSTTTGTNTVESTGGDVEIDASNNVDINSDSTIVSGELQFSTYGDTSLTGTFSTFLAADIDGNIIEVTADQILAEQTDSTIYNNNGVLTGSRNLDGDGNDLSFTDVGSLVDSSATSLSTTTGTNTVESTGGDVEIEGSTDVTITSGDNVDITSDSTLVSGELQLSSYGDTSLTGTFSTFLAVDVDGNVIEATADQILSEQTDSTIYNFDGVLTSNRNLDGDGNDLSFTGVGSLVDSSATSLSTTTGTNTVESTGGDVEIDANGLVDISSDSTLVSGDLQFSNYGDTSQRGTFSTFLAVDVDGNVIEATADEILAEQTDSTIYNFDGELTGDRTLDGTDSNSLTFDNLTEMDVNAIDINSRASSTNTISGDTTAISGITSVSITGLRVETNAFEDIVSTAVDSNQIIGANTIITGSTDVTIDGGEIDVNSTTGDITLNSSINNVDITSDSTLILGELQLSSYGDTSLTGTFSTFLAVDVDGNVIEATADQILSEQTDSTIYNFDGVLTSNRNLDGDDNDLSFTSIGSLVDSSATSLSTTTGTNTVESTGGEVVIDGSTDVTITSGDNVDITSDSTLILGELQLSSYGDTSLTGTFSTFLAVDVDGNVIEATADQILSEQEDSTIYTHDGVLTDQRFMTMDGNDLNFVGGSTIGDTTVIHNDGSISIGGSVVRQGTSTNVKLDVYGDIFAVQVHSSSDERFKKNIKPIQNALDRVKAINGVTYEFKTDEFQNRNFTEADQVGFIAQNVEEVLPEVVTTDDKGYKAVDYSKITALLNEAIKEQQEQIENLTKQLELAHNENKVFKSELADIKSMLKELTQVSEKKTVIGED